MGMTNNISTCKAKDPSTCRYHGTLGLRIEANLIAEQQRALRSEDFDLYTHATALLADLNAKRETETEEESKRSRFDSFYDFNVGEDPSPKTTAGAIYTLSLHRRGIDTVLPITDLESKTEHISFNLAEEGSIREFVPAESYNYDNDRGIETMMVVFPEEVVVDEELMEGVTAHIGYAKAATLHERNNKLRYNRIAKNAFVVNGFYDVDWSRTDKVESFVNGDDIRRFVSEGSPLRKDGTRLVPPASKLYTPRLFFTQSNL